MKKQDVVDFFDRCAPTWDADIIKNDYIIEKILDNAEIAENIDILDVACGTGVLFPFYLKRGVASITGIDISPKMSKIAADKYAAESKVQVICGDVEETLFDQKFDCIVVYNAFPHFPKPKRLIKILAGLLKEGGRLTIAHDASRETVNQHHNGSASHVSDELMSADTLKKLFDPHFDVEIMISNKKMYQLSGVKREPLVHSHGSITHTHAHGHEHHEHLSSEDSASLKEMLVMMKYLVSHNDAHAQEVADLAGELLSAGKCTAYDEIMDAVSDFDMVNAKLDAILNQLTAEEF